MRTISIEELKILQLDILDSIHSFCENNRLNYSLAFGSLLGAIRHKGYIPWDDDIDIMMPRPDYDIFIKSFNGAYPNLIVASPELDWGYYAPYANVYDSRTLLEEGANGHRGLELGVKIDVFPIDGTPESLEEYSHIRNQIWSMNGILYAKRLNLLLVKDKWPYIKTRLKYITKSYEQVQKDIVEVLSLNPFDLSLYVDQLVFNPYMSRMTRVKRNVFDNYIDVVFENRHYRIIADYDSFLSNVYGDYMTLPPKEKQIPHHGFTAFWK